MKSIAGLTYEQRHLRLGITSVSKFESSIQFIRDNIKWEVWDALSSNIKWVIDGAHPLDEEGKPVEGYLIIDLDKLSSANVILIELLNEDVLSEFRKNHQFDISVINFPDIM